ncbi:hypothetical protein KY366_06620 [Candidatus Woesearchaeota archaeon]|nr:hypothetical protein [Candidatus Woesearchaeota archaeon]
MEHKTSILFFCLILLIFPLAGCRSKSLISEYKSKEHGFSFLCPKSFKETSKEENRFALLDKEDNAILFIIENDPKETDILSLGKEQAYKDFSEEFSDEEIEELVRTIRTEKGRWYTYAIDFPEKSVKSIVSGTLCRGKEISIVLVTKDRDYGKNKDYYTGIISSFEC